MENNKYEITYIIRPDIDDAAKTDLVNRFDKILTDNGANVIDSKDWQKRRLAYEIGGYNEGTYHIVNVEEGDNDQGLNEFDRLAKFNKDILRHMIVRRDDK
ncbi:30S ribosomal protein S6 [Fructilactobacillus fructivorans]|uniref:Small ribosomal subunit protein bS6 n=1 Tax=Fructilactobacillus fructivorans TaxID=1614 RepID=A0A0C1PNV4_9LACO|nr:30S ribosomal protein S6 [Fructilactobacillus fructivorans]KID42442.1 SSU ribosomal protein S6p [Fructilactobacillus fructivorans]KRK58060.1 30S ribosomal protein S6 [Fructilactobacillus fructivorans]KRN13119.1 30S ribosomal protein S6 [Fructilactobacillus fructivorans]KRN41289.1 30S ribosomal protein S6 [Fructilactobacillus fructivorans]KRN43104.1 30S ribosomal protein S6 [Fructilactobacillus fructivorans]